MPEFGAMVNNSEEIIGDLLRAAEKLRLEGEREAACFCIDAVFVLLRRESRRASKHVAWAEEFDGMMVSH